jgi:hypothetical protein
MLEVEKPDQGHRRHAIQIVAQLPETQADALLILEAARDFVLKFLAEDHLEGAGALFKRSSIQESRGTPMEAPSAPSRVVARF